MGIALTCAAIAQICLGQTNSAPPPSPSHQPTTTSPGHNPASQPTQPVQRQRVADQPETERKTIGHLLQDSSWPRRAIVVMRLERYGCEESRDTLVRLLGDPAWQVRTFAIRTLGRRRITPDPSWLADGQDPRVLRDALRYRFPVALDRLQRGVKILARSGDLEDKMLAVEIAAASGDKELIDLAKTTAKQIIGRMDRAGAGALSSRLAILTGRRGIHRPWDWQQWLIQIGRRFELNPGFALEPGADSPPLSHIAQLDPDQFAALDTYMTKLSERELDLAICLDCTASMGGALAAGQGGVDDMMLFIRDMVASLRVAIVAYRDRKDEFETRTEDFTEDAGAARRQLWQLSADGGGDTPEAVYPALKLAFTQLAWRKDSTKALILVGDAPPHVGYGEMSAKLAQRAREEAELTTHVIQARNKPVKHFPEIAAAGGGRCVLLKDDDALVPEITGLTLADRFEDEFKEFFQVYLELCR